MTTYDFNRVDFSDPSSILSYGSEVAESISQTVDGLSDLLKNGKIVEVPQEKLDSISNFEGRINELKENEQKEAEKKTTKLKKFIEKILRREETDEKLTLEDYFNLYCEDLEEVIDAVAQTRENSQVNVEIISSFFKELKPAIAMLEEMIKVGEADNEAYKQETEQLSLELANDVTGDIARQINIRTKMSEIFSEKLMEQQKNLMILKEFMMQCSEAQTTSMNKALKADSFIRDTASILRGQGVLTVVNVQDAGELGFLNSAIDAANQAFVNNGKLGLSNLESSMKLQKKGNITIETIHTLAEQGKKAVQIVHDYNQQIAKQREIERKAIAQESSFIDQNIGNFAVATGETANMLGYEAPEALELPASNKTKKLGTKK